MTLNFGNNVENLRRECLSYYSLLKQLKKNKQTHKSLDKTMIVQSPSEVLQTIGFLSLFPLWSGGLESGAHCFGFIPANKSYPSSSALLIRIVAEASWSQSID